MWYLPTIVQTNQHMIQKSWSNLAVKKTQVFAGRPHIFRPIFACLSITAPWCRHFFMQCFPRLGCGVRPWIPCVDSTGFKASMILTSYKYRPAWPGARGQVWPGKVHSLTQSDAVSKFHWNSWQFSDSSFTISKIEMRFNSLETIHLFSVSERKIVNSCK